MGIEPTGGPTGPRAPLQRPISSYFNPFSEIHDAQMRLSTLSRGRQMKIWLLTGIAAFLTVGLGVSAAFRYLVYTNEELSSHAQSVGGRAAPIRAEELSSHAQSAGGGAAPIRAEEPPPPSKLRKEVREDQVVYIKKEDLDQAALAPLYSLFLPGIPLVQVEEKDGKFQPVDTEFVGAKEPNSSEAGQYKGLAQAALMAYVAGHQERRPQNALVDRENHFVLIDYKLNDQMLDGDLSADHCYGILSDFIGESYELKEVVHTPKFQDELSDAIVNFILFPLESIDWEIDNEKLIEKRQLLLQKVATGSNIALKAKVGERLQAAKAERIGENFSHSWIAKRADRNALNSELNRMISLQQRAWGRYT